MDRFFPGKIWLDTEGKRIQAHGGSVIYRDGVYYWYGENKEFTTGKDKIWTYGIRCYSSKDLYNWKDEGLILLPDTEHPDSPLYPENRIDRPHILYNERTKKFVCWLKIMYDDGTQSMTILTSEKLLGGYKIVREKFQPLGMNAGDFCFATDPDGKAYIYFEKVHSELICADLTEDYTDVTGKYTSHFPNQVPYVREAPAHFTRNGKHYLITSGTTGYFPNPSEAAVSLNPHGDFQVVGNPHENDDSQTSFHSQITCVFQVVGKDDLFIACADRWLPPYEHISYAQIERFFNLCVEGNYDEALKIKEKLGFPENDNTSIADYVWLPIKFKGDKPVIEWFDEWRWEEI